MKKKIKEKKITDSKNWKGEKCLTLTREEIKWNMYTEVQTEITIASNTEQKSTWTKCYWWKIL